MIELALQGLLVVLLVLTITWCIIVHYRLRRLRTDRGELEAFIAALGEATGRAEVAVQQMREVNAAADGNSREQERRARRQSAELARLMDNAVRVVQRLDATIEQGATRLAELRTLETSHHTAPRPMSRRPVSPQPASPQPASPCPVSPPETAVPSRSTGRQRAEPTRAAAVAAVSIDPPRQRQRSAQSVRREGQLGGLLHGELREALQGLR